MKGNSIRNFNVIVFFVLCLYRSDIVFMWLILFMDFGLKRIGF